MDQDGSAAPVSSSADIYETAIVVIRLPDEQVVRFQGILGGEDGLATMRCRDPEKVEQELWTTVAQLDELHAWLASLPESLQFEVLREEIMSGEDS